MLGAVDFLFGRFFTYRDVLVLSKQRLSKHTVTGFGSVFSICFNGEVSQAMKRPLNMRMTARTTHSWMAEWYNNYATSLSSTADTHVPLFKTTHFPPRHTKTQLSEHLLSFHVFIIK